jgi:hypothetical protein
MYKLKVIVYLKEASSTKLIPILFAIVDPYVEVKSFRFVVMSRMGTYLGNEGEERG